MNAVKENPVAASDIDPAAPDGPSPFDRLRDEINRLFAEPANVICGSGSADLEGLGRGTACAQPRQRAG